MTACYTARISVAPRQSFNLHASSAAGECALEIARVGAERRVVHRARVALEEIRHAVLGDENRGPSGPRPFIEESAYALVVRIEDFATARFLVGRGNRCLPLR